MDEEDEPPPRFGGGMGGGRNSEKTEIEREVVKSLQRIIASSAELRDGAEKIIEYQINKKSEECDETNYCTKQ